MRKAAICRRPLTLIALLGAAATPVGAERAFGVHASTLGLGVELTAGGPRLQGRVRLAGWDLDRDVSTSGLTYRGSLELRSVAALADWHPSGGGFRLTGGLVWNDHAYEGRAPLIDLLREELPALPPSLDLGLLRGTASPESLGPWLGLGWGRLSPHRRVGFSFDLGVVLLGDTDVDLTLDTSLPIDAIPGGRAFLEALLAEEELELEAEADDLETYPVVSFGVVFRF